MVNSAIAVANSIIARGRKEGIHITHLKLQKLVYLVQGWHLDMFDKPAFEEDLYVWQYGPVIETVYAAFRHNGSLPIVDEHPKPGLGCKVYYAKGKDMKTALDFVWKIYARKDALLLSAMSHAKGTPWAQAKKRKQRVIDKELIKEHFRAIGEGR